MGNTKLTLEIKNANDSSIKELTNKIQDLTIVEADKKNDFHAG